MPDSPTIIAVSLNPAIDRVLEVPGFRVGAHQEGREVSRVPGGKALNVSRVLVRLGVRSIVTGFLGVDNREAFAPALDEALVMDEFFPLDGHTRENVTIADPEANVETHVREPGLAVQPRHLERLRAKLGLLARADAVVVFSGSMPPGVDAEAFAALVDAAAGAGARVAVDTSGEALRAMVGRPLWLVKPNAAELAALAGRELSDLDAQLAAAREAARTVRVVLFTRGGEGAYLFAGELALHARVPVEPGRVRNTVGCGDALLGAFIGATVNGRGLEDAFADAVATATASAFGLATAEFDPGVRDELRAAIELAEL